MHTKKAGRQAARAGTRGTAASGRERKAARGGAGERERIPQRGNRLTSGERALLKCLLTETTLTQLQIALFMGVCSARAVSYYARGIARPREVRAAAFGLVRRRRASN